MELERRIAYRLATALLDGVWNRPALSRRARLLIGWAPAASRIGLIRAVAAEIGFDQPPPAERLATLVTELIGLDGPLASGLSRLPVPLQPIRWERPASFAGLGLPVLRSTRDLADWLDLPVDRLLAWAGHWREGPTEPRHRHYDYRFVPKREGPKRLLEIPRPRLKAVQRRILREILDRVPAHLAAHGFVRGRSCLGAASPHAAEPLVICVDLQNFFLETRIARVRALFRTLGYPAAVASLLTGLCTTITPTTLFEALAPSDRPDWPTRRFFTTPHLPQGAPTSPAIANLCAFGLDRRLAALARSFGGTYTRYADDLILSGDPALGLKIPNLLRLIGEIVGEEGFRLNPTKTRFMRRGARQQVLGIVVNERCAVARDERDRLKAILHNCRRFGPESQNRDGLPDFRAHLAGRIGWVGRVNPDQAIRLYAAFDAISWDVARPSLELPRTDA